MNLRLLFILAAVVTAFAFYAPANAAPRAQVNVDSVIVQSTAEFTLQVTLADGTLLAIPVQVDWVADGVTTEDGEDDSILTISPTVLVENDLPVTVEVADGVTGNLNILLTQTTSATANFTAIPINRIPPGVTGTSTVTETPAITETSNLTETSAITATAEITATPVVTETPPVTDGPVTNQIANLRGGPGTDYPIIGSAQLGEAIVVTGQNVDGTWYQLESGAWIFAALVDNAPAGLPVVETPALPVATAEPTTEAPILPLPTATPAP